MSQNLFDNSEFFEKYKALRDKAYNYNNLVEQPAIKALLPDLSGLKVLDLGCGFGSNCTDFTKRGAAHVVGVDISSKMIDVAKKENAGSAIEYSVMDMMDIPKLSHTFDLIFSSLAIHYVKDFAHLVKIIYEKLNPGGILLFSQEHPITTAPKFGPVWTKDDAGNRLYYNLADYMVSGERHVYWFIDGVEKYHRPLSEILNTLISTGFRIEKVVEPLPSQDALEKRPELADEFHKTSCIIIKAIKD